MDDFAQQLLDWLTGLSADDVRHYLVLAGALLCAYLLVRWFVRRFLPWFIRRVLLPMIRAIVVALGAVVLTVQALCATPFRVVAARPPVLVYRLGDAGMGVVLKIRGWTYRLALRSYFLHSLPRVVVVLVTAAVLWGGHEMTCRRDPESGLCRQPAATVTESVIDTWDRASGYVLA